MMSPSPSPPPPRVPLTEGRWVSAGHPPRPKKRCVGPVFVFIRKYLVSRWLWLMTEIPPTAAIYLTCQYSLPSMACDCSSSPLPLPTRGFASRTAPVPCVVKGNVMCYKNEKCSQCLALTRQKNAMFPP